MIVQPPDTHLAQLNVGRAVDALDGPRLAGFMSALDRVNAIAERSPGFVWRLQSDAGNATDIKLTEDPLFIINLSVWETPADLEHFVWQTVHKRFYDQKAKWFEPQAEAHFVMWWVPAGHLPTAQEALVKLDDYRAKGNSADAFGWEAIADSTLVKARACG